MPIVVSRWVKRKYPLCLCGEKILLLISFPKLNLRIDIVNTLVYVNQMLIEYTFQGIQFEWDRQKADINLQKHGISFETACEAFLDPLETKKYFALSRQDQSQR